MAKGRMLKTRIARSKKMGQLNDDSARLLYLMLLPHTDIKGRIEADPVLIRNFYMPYFLDWNESKIQTKLEDLHAVGLIVLYNIEDEQYLQFTRFEDFQSLRASRESESGIPEPPLQDNSRSAPALSKVKLSKVKLIKNGGRFEPSAPLKELIERCHKERKVNISMLINKFRKQQRERKALYEIPEEVYMAVCHAILNKKTPTQNYYPYFLKVLQMESDQYFANRQIQESQKFKRPDAMKDIIANMGFQ